MPACRHPISTPQDEDRPEAQIKYSGQTNIQTNSRSSIYRKSEKNRTLPRSTTLRYETYRVQRCLPLDPNKRAVPSWSGHAYRHRHQGSGYGSVFHLQTKLLGIESFYHGCQPSVVPNHMDPTTDLRTFNTPTYVYSEQLRLEMILCS